MTYGEFLLQILDSSTDVVTAAYNTGFEAGKKYVMEQLQKFLEENENEYNCLYCIIHLIFWMYVCLRILLCDDKSM